jgi:hypothetical protein
MRNAYCRTWNLERTQNNVEKEIHTLHDLEYGEKILKSWKMRKAHCKTWNMSRNIEKREK